MNLQSNPSQKSIICLSQIIMPCFLESVVSFLFSFLPSLYLCLSYSCPPIRSLYFSLHSHSLSFSGSSSSCVKFFPEFLCPSQIRIQNHTCSKPWHLNVFHVSSRFSCVCGLYFCILYIVSSRSRPDIVLCHLYTISNHAWLFYWFLFYYIYIITIATTHCFLWTNVLL